MTARTPRTGLLDVLAVLAVIYVPLSFSSSIAAANSGTG